MQQQRQECTAFKSLAQEVASKGVTVNTISPGYIMTAMVAAIGDEILEKIASTIPVGRLGNPDEVAYSVAFLASDRAALCDGLEPCYQWWSTYVLTSLNSCVVAKDSSQAFVLLRCTINYQH